MNNYIKCVFAIASLLCPCAAIEAQTLQECIDFARANSLTLKAADLRMQRSRQQEKTYFDIDKTELSLSQDPTSGGSPDNALTLSQQIDFPTVYSSRRKVLKAETNVEESRRAMTESELVRDVSSAYCTMLFHHHEAELLTRNDSVLAEFVKRANVRFNAGETNRLEVMNAERMRAENNMQLKTAQSNEQSAKILLLSLMNTSGDVAPTEDYHCVRLASDDYSFAATPQGALLENERVKAEKELSLTNQGYLPSFNVGVRHQLVLSGYNPYDVDRSRFEKGNWMGFEVGVAFPLFFGAQKAKTKTAKLDLSIASAARDEAERQSSAQFQVASNKVVTAQNTDAEYQSTQVPSAQEMRRLSLVEYENGDITYVEHIQNLSTALSVELAAAKATDDLNQAIISVNYLKGK